MEDWTVNQRQETQVGVFSLFGHFFFFTFYRLCTAHLSKLLTYEQSTVNLLNLFFRDTNYLATSNTKSTLLTTSMSLSTILLPSESTESKPITSIIVVNSLNQESLTIYA